MRDKAINFVGASCVGKTSVIELIKKSESFAGYEIVDSISRKLLKEGKISPSFNSIDNQKTIFDAYLKKAHSTIPYISDRCLIDVYTFTLTFPKDNRFVQSEILRQARLLEVNEYYLGKIFYFPIYWEVEKDGERMADPERRQQWDKNIREILERDQISYVTVPNVSPIERLQFIKSQLNL